MYRGNKRFNRVANLKSSENHNYHRYGEFPGDCELCTDEAAAGPRMHDSYGRAHFNNAPTTVAPIEQILAGIANIDIDGGPTKCTIRGSTSGRIWARSMTQELFEAQARLQEAGYEVKRHAGDDTHAYRLVVHYR